MSPASQALNSTALPTKIQDKPPERTADGNNTNRETISAWFAVPEQLPDTYRSPIHEHNVGSPRLGPGHDETTNLHTDFD